MFNIAEHLRRIKFKDPESGKTLVFLTVSPVTPKPNPELPPVAPEGRLRQINP